MCIEILSLCVMVIVKYESKYQWRGMEDKQKIMDSFVFLTFHWEVNKMANIVWNLLLFFALYLLISLPISLPFHFILI